jgi:hypothetical protein
VGSESFSHFFSVGVRNGTDKKQNVRFGFE